jgi:hypothetical protein
MQGGLLPRQERPMKENFLNPSDRAALQGLIPLAGALGAGTIFALFFGGRRRGPGIAVFELFAIVAVLAAVGTTAYLSIALLHNNEALTDRELTQTAAPLIFAVFLLVLVSVLSRLPGSAERAVTVLPLLLAAGVVAAYLASTAWSFKPGDTVLMAGLVLGIGGLTALLAWGSDRLDARWERGLEQRRFVRLSVAGYRVEERELRLSLPARGKGGDRQTVSCWTRKGRVYLDWLACRQLRDRADARWDRLSENKGRPPAGPAVLTRVHVRHYAFLRVGKGAARFSIFEPGRGEQVHTHEPKINDDRLFDVTDLGIV